MRADLFTKLMIINKSLGRLVENNFMVAAYSDNASSILVDLGENEYDIFVLHHNFQELVRLIGQIAIIHVREKKGVEEGLNAKERAEI